MKRQKTCEPRRAKLRRLHGPASADPTLCSDPVDVISLEQIWRVTGSGREACEEISDLFSYEEHHPNGQVFIRGFSFESLRSLLESGGTRHPVTNLQFPDEALRRAAELAEVLKLPKIPYSKNFADFSPEELNDENMEQFALEVFQMLAQFSIFISERMFMQLRPSQLTRLCLELRDLMQENLPDDVLDRLNEGRENPLYTSLRLDSDGLLSCQLLRQFILCETRYVLTTATLNQAPLIAYVFVGALAAVSSEVRKIFSDSLVHDFELESSSDSSGSSE